MLAFPLMQAFAARSDERTAVVVGLVLEAVGLVGVAMAIGGGALLMIPGLAIYGLGVGAATAQLSALVLADVPASRNGLASGISSAVRQLGSTLGVGLLGVVFTAALSGPLADRPVQTVVGAARERAGRRRRPGRRRPRQRPVRRRARLRRLPGRRRAGDPDAAAPRGRVRGRPGGGLSAMISL